MQVAAVPGLLWSAQSVAGQACAGRVLGTWGSQGGWPGVRLLLGPTGGFQGWFSAGPTLDSPGTRLGNDVALQTEVAGVQRVQPGLQMLPWVLPSSAVEAGLLTSGQAEGVLTSRHLPVTQGAAVLATSPHLGGGARCPWRFCWEGP